MDTITIVTAVALMWKIVDCVKFIRASDINAFVTQVVTWVAGVGVLWLLATSDFADGISFGTQNLGSLNASSLILVGASLSSVGSVGYDYMKARDNTQSAATPSLIPDSEEVAG